jgi:hypothetical protein
VTVTVCYGVLEYSFAVLLVPMHEGLNLSFSWLIAALSLALLASAAAGIPVGRALDRRSPRVLMGAGAARRCVRARGVRRDRGRSVDRRDAGQLRGGASFAAIVARYRSIGIRTGRPTRRARVDHPTTNCV